MLAKLYINKKRKEENLLIEVDILDEGMNMLGKMGVKDNNRNLFRRHGLGRVGPYRGAGLKNGYAIGSHNYKRDDLGDRKSTRLNSSHVAISYAVFCLKKKTK